MSEIPVAPSPVPYTLTRGAWYLLEGLLQTATAFPNTHLMTKRVNHLLRRLKRENKPISIIDDKTIDHSKPQVRENDISDLKWQQFAVAMGDAFSDWKEQPLTLDLKRKELAVLEIGIEWALKNRDKIWPENNEYILCILEAFDDDEDKDKD